MLIPPRADSPTAFPDPHSQDLTNAIRSAEELWRTSYPQIAYRSLQKAVTAVTDTNTLSGEAGTTKMDPLWGEAVPTALGTTWKQPHANVNPAVKAADASIYDPPIQIHARIQRTAREDQLKKYGFDRIRSLLVTIPCSLFDAVNINPKAGDRFQWDGDLYQVLQTSPLGWWMNTNTKLYIVMNCEHEHRGS